MFEIVAKREVAKHFKVGAVAGGLADVLDVGSADALLAGGGAFSRRRLDAGEVFFQRRHPRVDEKTAVVVARDVRRGGEDNVPFAFVKLEKFAAQVVESGPFHREKSHPV